MHARILAALIPAAAAASLTLGSSPVSLCLAEEAERLQQLPPQLDPGAPPRPGFGPFPPDRSATEPGSRDRTDGLWHELPPPARWNHSAVFDSRRELIVLLGGATYRSVRSEVWLLPLTRAPHWVPVFPGGQMGPRVSSAAAVYDARRDRVLLIGGYGADGQAHGEVWSFSLEGDPAWTPIVPAGSPLPPRFAHSAVYDRKTT